MPGGLAVVDIVASMIFAAMTGAGAATTAAVGGMMIPHMEEEGYDPGFASAIQAMGGVFGPIIPPRDVYKRQFSRAVGSPTNSTNLSFTSLILCMYSIIIISYFRQ